MDGQDIVSRASTGPLEIESSRAGPMGTQLQDHGTQSRHYIIQGTGTRFQDTRI
jgi:hypothetical protein